RRFLSQQPSGAVQHQYLGEPKRRGDASRGGHLEACLERCAHPQPKHARRAIYRSEFRSLQIDSIGQKLSGAESVDQDEAHTMNSRIMPGIVAMLVLPFSLSASLGGDTASVQADVAKFQG